MLTETLSSIDMSAIELSAADVAVRMLCAMLVGAIIGTEREFTHRPAGMRTHMLVSLGACAVMLTSQLLFVQYRPYGATPDPARLSAQVITGIGFLGAGTILKEGPTIKGLTTAASIWAVACLGVAMGAGYFAVGFIGAACMLLILTVFERLQALLLKNNYAMFSFSVTCKDIAYVLDLIRRLAAEADGVITSTEVEDSDDKQSFRVEFKVNFPGRGSAEREQRFFTGLTSDGRTHSATVVRV